MFERETRREKILESRNRELKLKEKTGAGAAHGDDVLENLDIKKFYLFIDYFFYLTKKACKRRSRSRSR